MFVVERAGTIRLVKKGRLLPTHGKARGANFGWNVFEGDKRNRPGSATTVANINRFVTSAA